MSLLINGLGKFNCAMAIPIHPLDCEDIQRPRIVLASEKTRLRVINNLAGLNMTVPEGNMKAFQIEGGNLFVPSAAVDSIGVLYPGERVVVVSGEQITHMTIDLDKENFVMPNPALTAVQTLPITTSKKNIRTLSQNRGTASSHFNLSTTRSSALVPPMPAKANQTLVIYNHLEMLARFDNVPMGFMNTTNWIPQAEPLVQVPRSEWDRHQFVHEIKSSSEWVDIVINNLDDKGHPFHLHGYDFYVLVSHAFPRRACYRTYNPFDPPKTWDERLYRRNWFISPPFTISPPGL